MELSKHQRLILILITLLLIAVVIGWENLNPLGRQSDDARPRIRKETTAKKVVDRSVREYSAVSEDANWEDSSSGKRLKARRTLALDAVPTLELQSLTATVNIQVTVTSSAEFWNRETRKWQKMDLEQYKNWTGVSYASVDSTFSAPASITKKIGDDGQPVITRQTAFGKAKDDPGWDWSEVENGIGIYLDWKEDNLIIEYVGAGMTRPEHLTKKMKINFPDGFETNSDHALVE